MNFPFRAVALTALQLQWEIRAGFTVYTILQTSRVRFLYDILKLMRRKTRRRWKALMKINRGIQMLICCKWDHVTSFFFLPFHFEFYVCGNSNCAAMRYFFQGCPWMSEEIDDLRINYIFHFYNVFILLCWFSI